jgi:hypothetical protein
MSLATGSPVADQRSAAQNTRAAIVAALATVEGVTAYPVVPDQATAGAAWPKWVQTTYDGPLCTLTRDTYECLVTLPASYVATTVDQGDAFRDRVAPALRTVGRVEFAEPVSITFNDKQTMPGLRLRLVTK